MRARRASSKCVSSAEWNSRRSPRSSTYPSSLPSATGSFREHGCMTPSPLDSGAPCASRLERLERLFWEADGMAPGEREAFLSVECANDPDLRRELNRMLAAGERAGAFLEQPLPELLAQDLPRGRLASWKLLQRVGEGGLGVVYRA